MYVRDVHGLLCPVCGRETRPLGLEAVHRIWLCPACGHRQVAPGATQLEELYREGYAGFTRDAVFAANVTAFMRDEMRPRIGAGSRLLDVGCGNGVVLDAAVAAGMRGTGIDISEAAVESCRARGLEATVGDFPTHAFPDLFDAITFWDVLEHLPEPGRFIERAAELLQPGGWLLVKVPGHGALSVLVSAFVPRMAGPLLQVPHHLQLFTRPSLRTLLGSCFGDEVWFAPRAMREPTRGGGARRRLGRSLVRGIVAASGDGNLMLLTRKLPTVAAS